MKRILFASLSLILAMIGCLGAPKFIHHPRPDLTVDFSAFENAGCESNNYGHLTCPPDSPLGTLGCDSIQKSSDLLGGLEPAYPLAICYIMPFQYAEGKETEPQFPDEGTYFYRDGGLFPRYVRYIIQRDGEFELIHNETELKRYLRR